MANDIYEIPTRLMDCCTVSSRHCRICYTTGRHTNYHALSEHAAINSIDPLMRDTLLNYPVRNVSKNKEMHKAGARPYIGPRQKFVALQVAVAPQQDITTPCPLCDRSEDDYQRGSHRSVNHHSSVDRYLIGKTPYFPSRNLQITRYMCCAGLYTARGTSWL